MSDPISPRVHEAPTGGPAWRPPVRRPSYRVAAGGVLVVFELPFLGQIGRLVGMGLVVAGVLALRDRAREPVARRRLNAAALLALVVAVTVAVLGIAAPTLEAGTRASGWAEAAAAAQTVLGVVGTVLLTAGMARESAARGQPDGEDAWWLAALAVVLVHGPILVAALLAYLDGRPGRVDGPPAIALFLVAVVPYALIARAGRHSDPPTPATAPRRAPGPRT